VKNFGATISTDLEVRRSMTDNFRPNSAKMHISSSDWPNVTNAAFAVPEVRWAMFAVKLRFVLEYTLTFSEDATRTLVDD
jgi:hypothetical protein